MKQATLVNLSACLGVLFLNSCQHPGMPVWDGKIWQGDPDSQSIVRTQANEMIYCSEEIFRDYVCVSLEDLQKLYANMLKCKKWGD